MNIQISDIESYLPETIISNQYLHEKLGFDIDFLENKIGIKERRIAGEDQTSSDMAYLSASKIFEKGQILPSDIDLLIVCTQNPDYKLPTTACILQNKLGLKTSCLAFDINLGCSGFIYSLIVASSMITAQTAKKALLVMVDQYSKIIDYTDKNTASLFGDAATACVIEKGDNGYGIISHNLGTDGSGAQHLIAYNSGINKQPEKNESLYMNGREIFKFSITTVPLSVDNTLKASNVEIKDVKYFIFHQANKYMLTEIKKKLNLTDEQLILDMEMYGNTVSSTIPLALKRLKDEKKLKKNDLIVLCGFGVGLSWGTILYKIQ